MGWVSDINCDRDVEKGQSNRTKFGNSSCFIFLFLWYMHSRESSQRVIVNSEDVYSAMVTISTMVDISVVLTQGPLQQYGPADPG